MIDGPNLDEFNEWRCKLVKRAAGGRVQDLFENALPRILCVCSGPLPLPATHERLLIWVAGRGRGPVPRVFVQTARLLWLLAVIDVLRWLR